MINLNAQVFTYDTVPFVSCNVQTDGQKRFTNTFRSWSFNF